MEDITMALIQYYKEQESREQALIVKVQLLMQENKELKRKINDMEVIA